MEKIPDNVKRAYEDGKRRKIMRFRMMKLIAAVLSALLLFGGCQSARRTEPADGTGAGNATEQTPPLPEETASETEALAAYPTALPESIDPLGFYRAQQEECLTADLAAEKFDAKYERVPGLYEIKNVYMDGRDVRLWLQTNEDETRIRQITLVQVYGHHLYETLYHEIVGVLGGADELSVYDDYYNRVPIETYDSDEHPFAVWNLDGYTLELGVNPPGNMAQGFYLAAFRGEYDEKMAGFFYEQDGPCCPHETNFHFTEECIFMDPELFRGDAAAIFEKYRATNAYNWEKSRRYPGDPEWPYAYVIEGIEYLGRDAKFTFFADINSNQIDKAKYTIDITGLDADAVRELYLQIYDALLGCGATPSFSYYEDPHSLAVDAFNSEAWTWMSYPENYFFLSPYGISMDARSCYGEPEPYQSEIWVSW